METITVRVPNSWREPIYRIKEKYRSDFEEGRAAIAAITAPPEPESPPEPDRPTTSAAVLIAAGVPPKLARSFAEITELFSYAPQAALGIMQAAMLSAVDAAPKPVPQGQSKFKLVNEYLTSDYFSYGSRGIKLPIDQELGPWPDHQIDLLEAQIRDRPYNYGKNAGFHTKVVRL